MKDYAKMYLNLEDEKKWHPADTMKKLKDNSEKEKLQFNTFVEFQIKKVFDDIWKLCLKRKVPRQSFFTWEEIEELKQRHLIIKKEGK